MLGARYAIEIFGRAPRCRDHNILDHRPGIPTLATPARALCRGDHCDDFVFSGVALEPTKRLDLFCVSGLGPLVRQLSFRISCPYRFDSASSDSHRFARDCACSSTWQNAWSDALQSDRNRQTAVPLDSNSYDSPSLGICGLQFDQFSQTQLDGACLAGGDTPARAGHGLFLG